MEKTALVLLCLAGFCVPASNQIRKFLFVKTGMSWSEAQSYCKEKHTDLATVRSQEEADQLLNITGDSLSDTAWIGLYRDDTQNWQWSNSDDVIYSNWKAELFCASVNSQGEWEDRVCNEKKAFMCYTETSNITERYTLIEELKTWTEAQQYCREHHTDLVSIKSASENEDLVKKAQGKPFWIGLFNNPWKWSHQGDNYTFHNWYRWKSSYEPNNEGGNEKCVVMNEKSEWYDTSCSEKFLFVCCSGGSSGNCSFEGTEKTWHEAQRYCRNHNKDLVTIQDKARMDDILKIILGNSTWIGLHRDKENWQWSNGGDVIYSNWRSQLFCASFNSKGGVWNESLCKETKPFMCYNENSNIKQRYTLDTLKLKKTWTEAQQYCREHHTDLVSIKNASENENLKNKGTDKPFWIGLFNKLWKWSHKGDKYTFHNWANEQPNNVEDNKKCVDIGLRNGQYQSRGEWHDKDCSLKLPFFCFDDHMAVGRVKFTAPRGMNLEDPKVSEAILEQIREHLSKSSPMDGVKLRWRKQDGDIFHKDEKEGCPKP